MTETPWYPFYNGDYAQKTSHLTMIEHGAYRLLLDQYYSTRQALTASAEQLHRICRAFAPEEQKAIDTILSQFFVLMGDGYHNERADDELARRASISRSRAKAAKIKHNKALQVQSKCSASAEQVHTQSQSQPQLQKERTKVLSYGPAFEEFWALYPKNNGSKKDAAVAYERSTRKGNPHEDILAGTRRYAAYVASRPDGRQFTKHASTWLNGQFWEAEWEPIAQHQLRRGNPALGDRRDPATRAHDEAERIIAERRAAREAAQGMPREPGRTHPAALPDLRQPKDLRRQGRDDGIPGQHVPTHPG